MSQNIGIGSFFYIHETRPLFLSIKKELLLYFFFRAHVEREASANVTSFKDRTVLILNEIFIIRIFYFDFYHTSERKEWQNEFSN